MVKNCFTVDMEDWYHGIELPYDTWNMYDRRIEIGFYKILDLLNKNNQKATFFTLGWVAEKYPHLIKEISSNGFELGSHGFSHEKVYNLSRDQFREEIKRTKNDIQNITGEEVVTHRSPFFSIISSNLWALDILAEEGYKIDCSISPVKTWRYGINKCPDNIFSIKENGLIEFPISSFSMFKKKWAIGGAYFRLLPYLLTSKNLQLRQKKGLYSMFYIHPWEYDSEHPRIKFDKKAMFTHYTNLGKTEQRTHKLFNQFKFETVSKIVNNYSIENEIEAKSIQFLQD